LQTHRDSWYDFYLRTGNTIPNFGSMQTSLPVVSLEAKLSFAGDTYVLQRIGCAGLQAKIINRAQRVARVREIEVRLLGFDILPQMQRAFNTSFGYTPTEKGNAESVFTVGLIPICHPAGEDCSLIEQDQGVRFLLPFCRASSPLFTTNNPKHLSLCAIMDDDTEVMLLDGDLLHEQLKVVVELLDGKMAEPKHSVKFGQKVASKTKPAQDAVGKVNVNPVSFENKPVSAPLDEPLNEVMPLFSLIWKNWTLTKRFEYKIVPLAPIDVLNSGAMRNARFRVGVGNTGTEIDGRCLAILFTLISDQAQQMNDAKGNLKNPSTPEFSSLVNLQPTDEQIAVAISQLRIEPVEGESPFR
jgi:hypothetical protein